MEQDKTKSQPLGEALKQPNGARFYRCALQVNPFAYQGRHAKQTAFHSEDEYNRAIVSMCLEQRIEATGSLTITVTADILVLLCIPLRSIFAQKNQNAHCH